MVIGAGIVGNSLACHLARLGWTDIVQLDKGPLPNPGGSTGHASNFIYPVDHSREMTALTLDSVRQYKELGVLTECGGIEVARTEERMEELRRRIASAKSWGVEPVSLVTPAEIKELVPFIDESVIVGGFYSPGVAVVDSLRAGTLMREEAQQSGALTVAANIEVTGIDTERRPRQRACARRAGDIEAETVVICCGVWSPLLARMAGASIPLTPAVHQMIDIGPVPRFADAKGAIEYPIVRDMDTNMYERQDGRGLEIGSYAHRPILHDPAEIPSIEESALSPTELPFTQDDFAEQLEHALELMPEIVGDETVGIKYAINGLLSLTPDGLPLLGETPEVKRPLVGGRGLGQGGPGRRARRRRVDDPRRARDRPPGVRHRALLPVPADRRARPRPRRGGLQQDLRDRPPGRAVGELARDPAVPVPRARAGARRGLLRGRRLGAPALVRLEREAARRLRRPRASRARRSGRRAGGRRSSTPSTSRCATARRCST